MLRPLFIFVVSSLLITLSLAEGELYQARCDVGVTPNNETLDTCDSTRFLKCQDGRCLCQDQANLIWSSMATKPPTIQIVLSRTKRAKGGSKGKGKGGSKGGGSKGGGAGSIATAAVAGGAGGLLAGSVVSGISRPSIGSFASRRTTTESSVTRTRRYHSCYSRVGAECVIENSSVNGDVILNIKNNATSTTQAPSSTSSMTTTTTTQAPEISSSTTEVAKNETESTTVASISTTAATVAAAATVNETVSTPATVSGTTEATTTTTVASSILLQRIPKCVEFAVCAIPPVKIVNGVVISGDPTGRDPRLGVCQCGPGYRANSQDICVKI